MVFFPWNRLKRNKGVWLSLSLMLLFAFVAITASVIAPKDPYAMDRLSKNLPPMWVKDASPPGAAEYPLGTDYFGRDILSRMIYGTRTAFFLALMAVGMAAILGSLVGLVSGYIGGWVDGIIVIFLDTVTALPTIMFMVIIVLILRAFFTPSWFHGMVTLVVGFAVVGWVSLARLVRINVLQIKSQFFIEASISLGASRGFVIFHHLIPNVLHVIIVWIINMIPAVILLEAVLGYVGIGVTSAIDGGQFSVVSWGGLFFSGRSAWSRNPFMLMIPSASILLISMSFIMLGDYLTRLTHQN